jgi:hypothetical protein
MTSAIALGLLKLLLGSAAFAVLGYVGRFYDKRIAGVLLTFPILNGIGILTGADPLAVADSIYAVVVFNGLLLFLTISCCRVLPPLPDTASAHTKLVARLAVWTMIWALGAVLVVLYRRHLPGPLGLFLIQIAIAVTAAVVIWKAPRHDLAMPPAARTFAAHGRALFAFWWNGAGFLRLGLFVVCCVLLLVAANFYESKWIGMLSALPLPGLFAVATLSALETRQDFDLIRDSVLLGPVSVVAFNWIFAQIVAALPSNPAMHTMLGTSALILLLLADAVSIFWIVPRISAYLDRVRKPV